MSNFGMSNFITNAELLMEAEQLCDENDALKAENEKLQAENKNLIANYEMLSVSYMDYKRVGEHLLKRYKSLLRAKLPERELMLIDENEKLRDLLQRLLTEYRYMRSRPRRVYLQHEGRMRVIEEEMRELGIEVPK